MRRRVGLRGIASVISVLAAVSPLDAQPSRTLRPEDLFRVRQVGATAWSPDGLFTTIEFSRPGRTLDTSVPTSEIALLDVKSGALRTLTSNDASYVGFINAVWSPGGKSLAFLSVDSSASVRAWIWTSGAKAPTRLNDLDVRVSFGDSPIAWIDDDRLAVVAWDVGAEKSGDLYFRILRGPNAAAEWKRTLDAQSPSVSVLESGRSKVAAPPTARLVSIDLRANRRATLARGAIHQMKVSADHRFIAFRQETPKPASSYFEPAADAEAMYGAVNWGTESHVIDARSGAGAEASSMTAAPKPVAKADPNAPLPRPDARRLSAAPDGQAALYLANVPDGSHLWLSKGASHKEIWTANQWMAEIKTGQARPLSYTAADGTPLTAWLLLPPSYVPGVKLPMVTFVYPNTMYRSAAPPSSFSLFRTDFNHPQLFAALGYAVLLPSMPPPKDPADAHSLALLTSGVLPAVDAAIEPGIADPNRVAVYGQSDGGFTTLGLVTQTNRFRTAIASASFSDLISLYGTFYGQYRHGDAGPPQMGQLFRMLQMERGVFNLGSPPWQELDRYRAGSSVMAAGKVQTPLMLVHGDLDFVPIQQAEEFFTALYRQDKRALFVRYQGEWHTIANRANVLDLWQRIGDWLSETMPPEK
jgi:dipeptidyl aminopeptidase/acylaminoacyl peptidase